MATDVNDLASSLAQEEIPVKLRCASCNKLVVNAVRLPCCDQNICEQCYQNLPESCPVCEHTPLSAEDCKPNKALRLTIKAFLKNEEKKRDKLKAETTPVPVATTPAPVATTPAVESVVPSIENLEPQTTEVKSSEILNSTEGLVQPADETASTTRQQTSQDVAASAINADVADDTAAREMQAVQETKVLEREDEGGKAPKSQDTAQDDVSNTNSGFTGMNNGLSNQNWATNTAFNPMMAMNGMGGGGYNGFSNMMGMSGMGMDPMMMANGMFGGYSGQNMGMNGMNMNMGFDGGFGNWGASSSLGMNGMNGGNFGANAGYYPGGGYNQQSHQGHFNQMHPQRQFQLNNYSQQNRFRGRGYSSQRGFGRGYRSQHQQDNFHARHGSSQPPSFEANGQPFDQRDERDLQDPTQQRLDDEEYQVDVAADNAQPISQPPAGQVAEAAVFNAELVPSEAQATTEDDAIVEQVMASADSITNVEQQGNSVGDEKSATIDESASQDDSMKLQPIATVDVSEPDTMRNSYGNDPAVNQDFAMPPPTGPASTMMNVSHQYGPGLANGFYPRGRGGARGFGRGPNDFRNGFRGRGGYPGGFDMAGPSQPQPTGTGVAGAPTGPKAMRDGLPNTGIRGRAGPGFSIAGRGGRNTVNSLGHAPAADNAAGSPTSSRSRARSYSRSHSRSRSPARSKMADRDEQDTQDDRKRSHSKRHEDEAAHRTNDSRDQSRDSSRGKDDRPKSKHGERERSRERRKRSHRSRSPADDEAKMRSSESSRRRSRRERSRERHRDKDRDHDYKDEQRSSRHSPDRDGRRSSHHTSRDRADSTSASIPVQPPTGPREFKIRNRSKQVQQTSAPPQTDLEAQKEAVRAEQPNIDPHTLEREARNRERMAKEQQRRSEALGAGGRKRSAGEMNGHDPAAAMQRQIEGSRRKVRHVSGAGKRRVSYQYEGEENAEARAKRIEEEREAGRWG